MALLNTGSVKSFINENIHAALDFNNVRNKPVDPGRYISITGDPLNIKCKISCDGESPKRKMFYQGDFLVSSNIRHECLLGWDFIANNGLTLRAAENNGRHFVLCPRPPWDFSHFLATWARYGITLVRGSLGLWRCRTTMWGLQCTLKGPGYSSRNDYSTSPLRSHSRRENNPFS